MPIKRRKYSVNTCKLLYTSFKYQTEEFFNYSTLHGVRYIGGHNRPIFEKIIWLLLVITGAIATLVIILLLWDKFMINPTITGLDIDFHSWDIPFPGITICPENKASPELINAFINDTWNDNVLNDDGKKYYFDFINLLSNLTYANLNEIDKYKNDKNLPQEHLKDIVFSVVKHCEDLIYSCEWKGEKYNCCDGFLPIFTEVGFCYSFNTLIGETNWPWKNDSEFISLKTNYIHESDTQWSLQFDGDSSTNPYSIYIHSSEELPTIEMSPQHVWTKAIHKIKFASKTTYTTEGSRQLSAKQRKCIFPDEVKLATSAKYSYWACRADCRMRFATKICSCVPFFYHQVDGFPYCDLNGLICLSKYTDVLRNSLHCNCELGCMNTEYEVEKLVESRRNSPIEIGFISWPMVIYKREVLFGLTELLVAFGGIAGLFLGFSLLSAVEIIYYFTMRTTCMLCKQRDKLEKLAELEVHQRSLPTNRIKHFNDNQRFTKRNQHLVILPYLD